MSKKSAGSKKSKSNVNEVVDNGASEQVQSVELNETNPTPEENEVTETQTETTQPTTFTFKLQRDSNGNVVLNNAGAAAYKVDGRSGILRVAPQLFSSVDALPETIEAALPLPEATTNEPKSKLSKEERKALRDAMTPAQKLEAQERRLEKQRANLLARKAKLGIGDAAEVDSTDEDVDAEEIAEEQEASL